ncbi:MAG: hypothetical protein KH355_15220 [Clostridiales bacterium]|nr:hypothetical protein [Clostridiales bacterium]
MKQKKKWKLLKMPKLSLYFRLLLYLLMFLSVTLSLVSVAFEYFPYRTEMVFYILAAVTLFGGSYYLIWDIRYGIKEMIRPSIAANPFTNRISSDYRMRTILFAVPGLVSNIVFAIFNGVTGFMSHSAWFGSLSAYYILLSIMRIGIVKQEKKISKIKQNKERMAEEIVIYQKNSVLFIIMAVVLAGMVILLETSLGGKTYPGFTIYAAATYAFYRIIMSTINMIKVKKRNSPLLTSIRKIGYMDACVSILTLQTAMFASFGNGEELFIKWMNGATGIVVCLLVLGIGIQGIYVSKKMKQHL